MKPAFISATDAQILAYNPSSPEWVEYGFYYPTDKAYFYQALDGVMKKYGDGDDDEDWGTGVTLNDKSIGGVKTLIESVDVLNIPENYDYNIFVLNVEGIINCEGQINLL